MYYIESIQGKRERICLDEGKWVVWLRGNINAHNVKACSRIANCTATGTTKKIE